MNQQNASRNGHAGSRKAGLHSEAFEPARRRLLRASRAVVITKFRYMGDSITATPFLAQLRRHCPDLHVTLLTSPTAAVALANCPYVNRTVALDSHQVGRYRHTRDLFRELRAPRFEVAFLPNRSFHSAMIAWLARIGLRIGYANELRAPILNVPVPYAYDRHEADCHLDMLRVLGLAAEQALPELWITSAELEAARKRLAAHGLARGGYDGPLVGLQPGANDPYIREWGAERYAGVVDSVLRRYGGAALILGGTEEQRTSVRLEEAMSARAVNLTGKLDLRQALAIIGLCDLWVGNDTGLLHAAVAQRVPSVGLFGPNKVARWGYDTPRHRSLVVFPSRPARNDAAVRTSLDAITPAMVLEAVRDVMQAAGEDPLQPPARVDAPGSGNGCAPYFDASRRPAHPVPRR